MRFLLFVFLFISMIGCNKEYKAEEVLVEIVYVSEKDANCMFDKPATTVKTPDNRVDTVCQRLGNKGDKVKGYWVSGAFDSTNNGFRSSI